MSTDMIIQVEIHIPVIAVSTEQDEKDVFQYFILHCCDLLL